MLLKVFGCSNVPQNATFQLQVKMSLCLLDKASFGGITQ